MDLVKRATRADARGDSSGGAAFSFLLADAQKALMPVRFHHGVAMKRFDISQLSVVEAAFGRTFSRAPGFDLADEVDVLLSSLPQPAGGARRDDTRIDALRKELRREALAAVQEAVKSSPVKGAPAKGAPAKGAHAAAAPAASAPSKRPRGGGPPAAEDEDEN